MYLRDARTTAGSCLCSFGGLAMSADAPVPRPCGARRFDPRWKVLYLVGATAGALATPWSLRPYVVPTLLLLQVSLLLALRVSTRNLIAMMTRLKGLFGFLGICYLLLPGAETDWVIYVPVRVFDWSLPLNLTGFGTAAILSGQILTVVLASAVVRLSGPESDLVEALQKLRCPRLLGYSIDNTLALVGGIDRVRRTRGQGRGDSGAGTEGPRAGQSLSEDGRQKAGPGFWAIARQLIRGDVVFLVDSIRSGMDRAAERSSRTISLVDQRDPHLVHDVQIISGIAMLMISMKILKILPGVAFASGHKTLILIPLYILAAHLTYARFGATTAGLIMGLTGYLNGDGRYGILDLLKHVVPGLTIDLLWPVICRRPRRIWVYSILGIIAALSRVSTELILALLLGARWEIFLGLTWRVASNLLAGALSGTVTYMLLPAFRGLKPAQIDLCPQGVPDVATPSQDRVPDPLRSEPKDHFSQ